MKEIEFIRDFYRPIQPAVKIGAEEIVYQETRPVKKIESFVYCFWQLKTIKPLKEPLVYRVVSDGCIDIFFDHNQPTENFVMGFCRKYTEFAIGNDFDYMGIRFLPSAFPLLFGINAQHLSNQSQELKQVLPNFSQWIENNIHSKLSFEKIVNLLNDKLSIHIQNRHFDVDHRFLNALKLIFQNRGFLDTETDLTTGLSPRQLQRVFNYHIGTTPKAFSNVIRFQHILSAKPSKQSLKENKLYFDLGFFDQAHFIKNFKTFYGVTPSEAFQ
ncbi:AraC-like DNA-binding protein [Algoriphagus sp. 4150]|uniref:AraC family transcriptional regulator n=1 Tax=Algoriphagus sp. 4150 TaxID=2817756 RepID=UPI00285E6D42|nr:helix-turn-helix domain-containing protein [Algoriphagus sp. 4150]MDR7128133.1 AraC-like DNA-binding protein [Algoriphagus sp. 4150]